MSDDDIRRRLERRLRELNTRSERINAALLRDVGPLEGGFTDRAVARANDPVLRAIRGAAGEEQQQIAHALLRLDAGEYGRCESCGSAIAADRLRALPYATACAGCLTA